MESANQSVVTFNESANRFSGNYRVAFLSMRSTASHSLINVIEAFVKKNAKDISSSQLRGIFSQVKRADTGQIPMLRAKIAYVKGRTEGKKKGMHALLDVLNSLMKEIDRDDREKLDSFKDFFEAILSFHKFYGTN